MSDVPAEILREILARLPVAPLLRFRCVSKQWKYLIDSNDFLKHHLNHSRKSNSHHNIIMREGELYSIDFDLLNETNRVSFQQPSHPFKDTGYVTLVLAMGSCDGVLALSNGDPGYENLIFWNPSVRSFYKLPKPGFKFPKSSSLCDFIVFGFGYDFVSDDYKLVRIVQFFGVGDDVLDSEVKVFNRKSQSWRRIPDFPYYLKYPGSHGELVNGALHWLVSRKRESDTNSLVAAFDLGTEEYSLVPLPEYARDNVHLNVYVLGGCLSIACRYYMNRVDLWVMKEYGVKESWSILFTLSHSDTSFMQNDNLKPIVYSKCGRKVLAVVDGNLLMWYDLDKNSTDLPAIQRPIKYCYDFYPCLQSLVLLKSLLNKSKRREKRRGKREVLEKARISCTTWCFKVLELKFQWKLDFDGFDQKSQEGCFGVSVCRRKPRIEKIHFIFSLSVDYYALYLGFVMSINASF